ncbi:MAG: M20/M25/M40 family metallo-hydrolase [Chitinophagaceae bacterium]
MIKKILGLALLAVVILTIILLVNTFRFPKGTPGGAPAVITGVSDSVAQHLSTAIQIKTVSFGDTLAIDTAEFLKFRAFMETTYPVMHAKLPMMSFNEFSYVFTWKGKDTVSKPIVLMAHLDVVPVEAIAEKKWTVPSFSGAIKGDTVWGRGAVDDKASAICIMEATEQLLKEGWVPDRTIYICFGHDEEISGKRGANVIAKWFSDNNIHPELVVDEGGMIDTENMPELKRPIALIGVGEKGYVNVDLTVEIPGGHSSMPMKETAIDVLNKAINNVRKQQMPARVTPAVDEFMRSIGPYQGFVNRLAISNMWLFSNTIISKLEASHKSNAMVHTTIVPTIVDAGIKDNVIPSVAKATFNSRILPGETSDDVVNFFIKTINDDRVQVKKQSISLMEASPSTSSQHPMYKRVQAAVKETAPDAIVTPYLVIGATDSRYFRKFSDAVLNFTPLTNAKGFHGIDERVGIQDLVRSVHFYKVLIKGGK